MPYSTGLCKHALSRPTLSTDKFRDYVTDQVKKQAEKADLKHGPVVILVHGFLADPRDEIRGKSQAGDNPHACSFHFEREPEHVNWRHTASWPCGLGLAPDKTGRKGGLPIAFGWNSFPDILTAIKREPLKIVGLLKEKLKPLDVLRIATDLKALVGAVPEIRKAFQPLQRSLDPKTYARVVQDLDNILCQYEGNLANIADRLPEVYREPFDRAKEVAWVLVNTIRAVAKALPDKPVDLFCHSLGTRVVLQALHQMAEEAQKQTPEGKELADLLKQVGRVVLVGGAEYTTHALDALGAVKKALPEGAGPSFYNFMARRDRVLAVLAQRFHPISPTLEKTIGLFGLDTEEQDLDRRWIDLQLDKDKDGKHPLNEWLTSKQKPPVTGVHRYGILNHWNYFTSDDNMSVYRVILHDRAWWDIDALRKQKIPQRTKKEQVTQDNCAQPPK